MINDSKIVRGKGVVLNLDNLDTDQLVPARFMSVSRSEGYSDFLFYDLRRLENGQFDESFPINIVKGASFLIAGKNFGMGSSREAAVYALCDFGFRVLVAPSFSDIFAANAVNNGLIPVKINQTHLKSISLEAQKNDTQCILDLEALLLKVGSVEITFDLDPIWKEKLLKGWDDIDMGLSHVQDILLFSKMLRSEKPWVFPLEAK
tara:strand:- start:366 stop:980 length:615 start_codon:yes stop_codon:yes gene_type:complete